MKKEIKIKFMRCMLKASYEYSRDNPEVYEKHQMMNRNVLDGWSKEELFNKLKWSNTARDKYAL